MKRNKKEEIEEIEEEKEEEEVTKKKRRGEGVAKRKALKQKDKVARWSGFILLLLVLIFGFLLWVAGEIGV